MLKIVPALIFSLTASALTFTSTATANAVDWDGVASCESGNNWSINTGNGYFGGLQFAQPTWRAYGGTQFAPVASSATKTQQIVIAERVLRGQGLGAWPVCGRRG